MYSFLSKHRNKLLVASAVGAVTAGVVYYMTQLSDKPLAEEVTVTSDVSDETFSTPAVKVNKSNKSRLLMRIRRQFHMACQQFMPTLKAKIIEVVDMTGTVRQIKEIRSKSISGDSKELEAELWEEIKVSTFTILFVTSYMLCAISTLLKLQLHLLGRFVYKPTTTTRERALGTNPSEEPMLDSDMFHELIDGTYKQLFGNGIRTFAVLVKERMTKDLSSWTVSNKLTVDFSELTHMLASVRRNIEVDVGSVVQMIFIPPGAISTVVEGHSSGNTMSAPVQKLLAETWDLLDCPMFCEVYTESVDRCFRIVSDELQRNVFSLGSRVPEKDRPRSAAASAASPTLPLRTPPLASLLPQIKAIATNLLQPSSPPPSSSLYNQDNSLLDGSNSGSVVSSIIKEVSSGPALDSFCVSMLETTTNY